MDLSKAFDFIPHGLVTAKLAMHGMNNSALRLMYHTSRIGNSGFESITHIPLLNCPSSF